MSLFSSVVFDTSSTDINPTFFASSSIFSNSWNSSFTPPGNSTDLKSGSSQGIIASAMSVTVIMSMLTLGKMRCAKATNTATIEIIILIFFSQS